MALHNRFAPLAILLATVILSGCSPNGEYSTASNASMLGEQSKPGAFLAYEHLLTIQLPAELIEDRLKAARDACNDERFGSCDVLAISQRGSSLNYGQLVVRIAPGGVEPLTRLASEGGQLAMRESRAEDLAQAVADSAMQKQRLQREYAALQEHQNRSDLSVTDLLALTERIAAVETQLAAVDKDQAQQKRRIATNLLTLDFTSEYRAPGRLSRIGDAFTDTLDNLTEGFVDTIRFIGYILPFLLILFPLALALRWFWKRITRRSKRT